MSNDDAVGFGKLWAIDSTTADRALIGEKNFILHSCREVIDNLVDLRRKSGAPHGRYELQIQFIVDRDK